MSESVRGKYYIFNIFQTHLSNFIELSLYLFKTQNGMLIFSKLIDVLDFNFLWNWQNNFKPIFVKSLMNFFLFSHYMNLCVSFKVRLCLSPSFHRCKKTMPLYVFTQDLFSWIRSLNKCVAFKTKRHDASNVLIYQVDKLSTCI